MTTGMSLEAWEKKGFLDRELGIYRRLAEALDCRIVFLSYGGQDEVQYLSGEECFGVVPKQISGISDLSYSLAMGRSLRSIWDQFSLIKTNQMRGAWAGIRARKKHKIPFVVRCGFEWLLYASYRHEELLGRKRPIYFKMVKEMERRVYRNADAIMLPGDAAARFVRKTFKVQDNKVHVFLNSIDIERFKPNPQLMPIPGRISFVGRLAHVKRLDLLIEAMGDLKDVHLCAVGEGPDKDKLVALADAKGVEHQFYDRVPNTALPEILNQSEIFVLPSIKEGNPKALMEAMACGRPCIATDAPGSEDLIQHEKNGLLVSADPASIARAVQRLRDKPEWAQELGANARRFAEEHFDLEQNIRREASLLNGLMNKT